MILAENLMMHLLFISINLKLSESTLSKGIIIHAYSYQGRKGNSSITIKNHILARTGM